MIHSRTGTTSTFLLGSKRKEHDIHLGLLSQYPELKAGLGLHKKESETRPKVYLEIDEPEMFGLLMNWLYRGVLSSISTSSDTVAILEATRYVKLYFKMEECNMMIFRMLSLMFFALGRPAMRAGSLARSSNQSTAGLRGILLYAATSLTLSSIRGNFGPTVQDR